MPDVIVARFEFDQDEAPLFLEDGKTFIEMQFDSVDEVIEYCTEFENAIIDCTALINGRVVSLADQPTE